MVIKNPNFPEVLGHEFMADTDQKARVWSGAPGRMMRIPSTAAETIGTLRLSAAVNPLQRATIPTLIDVIPEGSEMTAIPLLAKLTPNSDNVNTNWVTGTGSSSNLFAELDEDTATWPGPASVGEIKPLSAGAQYACGVDASLFNGGAAANGRIFAVSIGTILAASIGFRKLSVYLMINGNLYQPSGGPTRDVHYFGEPWEYQFGEINPDSGLPWTPADIAKFDTLANWGIRVHVAGGMTATEYPRVMALSLNVRYLNTENRVAVGVYTRPADIGTARLITVDTTALRAMPAGTANWSKPASGNFLFYWRQTASPSQYGPVVAEDLQWNGAYQDLGPDGQPAGIVYPYSSSGASPPPSTVLASQAIAYDSWGRPQEAFTGASRAAYGIVLRTTAPADSVDSQPYRMDLSDLVLFRSGSGITGQRLTPASTQTYVGIRLPIIPPATATSTLTATVNLTAGGAQQGGTFTITAAEVRAIQAGTGGVRYVTGFFVGGNPTLTAATQYEIRLSVTGSADWIVYAPDCSLGAGTGFGGTTDGALIAGSHVTTRDTSVTLIRQPNPPTGVTAALANKAITVGYVAAQVPTRQVVNVAWTPPVSGMGANFYRYELERQEDSGTWMRIAHFYQSAANSYQDPETQRATLTGYRIRAVGKDGRITSWVTSNNVTPTTTGLLLILTSAHNPSMEVCYFYDRESAYLVLSNQRDETVLIHGAKNAVVFMERDDRGVGFQCNIWVNQVSLTGKGGANVLTPLLNLIRPAADGSLPVPYVCMLDNQGTRIMGHVSVEEVPQLQPAHRYTAQITVTPTHSVPVPVEVP